MEENPYKSSTGEAETSRADKRRVKQGVIALVAAVITEVVLVLCLMASPGGNAQGIWIPSTAWVIYVCAHLPATVITDWLGIGMDWSFVISIVSGVPQFFLIYYGALSMWGWVRRGHALPAWW